ncbi:alpha-ketoglutarate-dependent dioxygenase AlkB family protein [Echinicola vietnamensis]|uniref:Alkylated DNA repair protein n=1 Tax=Echinicola vietnamensis (strain DSM 17526 / LMG 23754 / KMM 6221) TaxID=926556 RepID=L0FZJ2_ECHVK|nr:alpha-ketoglutarate-dependent dioxygenase AlkB [Echinicola vietnamensis]AGA79354.1 alkylated DNA repair protein [Echinicola vietnamensis DSM 17526]
MDLFSQNSLPNILPFDGTVHYYGKIFSQEQSTDYFDKLFHHIEWRHDEAVLYGKHYVTKRKVAWYGDSPFEYRYSGTTKQALPWTPALKELKAIVEAKSGNIFNSCLLNLYHEGSEGMAWHSDGEKMLGDDPIVTSLTFGAERKFSFKHKTTKQTVSLILENGSLLVMREGSQKNWLHRLPPTKKVTRPRISLTFRRIIE